MQIIEPQHKNIIDFTVPKDATLKYHTVLYIYTTAKMYPATKDGSARRLAFSAEHAAHIRAKEQQTAKNSADPYILLHVIDVSEECETGNESESLTKLRGYEAFVHRRLKQQGMWVPSDNPRSEWFQDPIGNDINVVVGAAFKAINEYRYGVARSMSYAMRDEQAEAVAKFKNIFTNGISNQALLDAIMRMGKTHVSYQVAKAIGAKRILIITSKPSVSSSWRDDLNNHVAFDGWQFLYNKDFDKNNPVILPSSNDPVVLFVSFQDIIHMQKAKWKFIKKYHFDFVVVDEMHYGSDTDKAQKTLNALNYTNILYVSGTPLKAKLSGRFTEDETFTWSYIDEQEKKRKEALHGLTQAYRWLPELKVHLFNICEEAKKVTSVFSDEEGYTALKMYRSDDGKTFAEEACVSIFVDQLIGKHLPSLRNNNPNKILGALKHIFIYMPPSTKSVDAMCALLEKKLKGRVKIINASGDNITSIDDVNLLIASNERTITVSCARFNTGSSVPEWNAVVMLDDTHAPETYWQTVFRCKTPNEKDAKEYGYVIDFNPQRYLEMANDYAYYNTPKGGKPSETLRKFLDFAPVMEHDDNGVVAVDVEKIFKSLAQSSNSSNKFNSNSLFNMRNLNDNIAAIFNKVSLEKTAKVEVEISDNGIQPGKNFASGEKEEKETEEKEDNVVNDTERKETLEMLRQKIRQTINQIPKYVFVESPDIECANDIFAKDDDYAFTKIVGISLDEFKMLCDNFIEVDRLDRAIMEYNQIIKM